MSSDAIRANLTLIRVHADPTVGPVRVILDDPTSSDGEKIELLLGIFAIIYEVSNASETSYPTVAQSSTRRSP